MASNVLGLYSLTDPLPSFEQANESEARWNLSSLGTDDTLLTPTQSLPRRPSLPKRTVSDFSAGESTVAYRRRRTLANVHGSSRSRVGRRPSSSTGPSVELTPCSPPPMVRSVSMPVATQTEYERQRRTQSDKMLAPIHSLPTPTLQDGDAVAWSFSWPTKTAGASTEAAAGPRHLHSPARRPSTCSPFEMTSELEEEHEFPWTDASLEMPVLSPSSTSNLSIAESSGPPSPVDLKSPYNSSRRLPAFAASAISASLSPSPSPSSMSISLSSSTSSGSASSSSSFSSTSSFCPPPKTTSTLPFHSFHKMAPTTQPISIFSSASSPAAASLLQDRVNFDSFLTPLGEEIVIHPGHCSLPPIFS
ncbi:hypothetical protein OC834_002844 [Tilletia horrida]|uniref:Uncharacterized protein n=1 Tax=Tilletia horrida TaxID=155126 RepID=A0AAN6JNG2_9BASI|nr:hypothetical protein OC842_006338 [Tilletia horrida]KAK0531746.1 hypothetical protein OC834_002844 [Tilletia horrida]KAK0539861.1 hypothetical protein OC835_000956 [Tilletia horrida]KAK0561828.1 hypothetical protein OC844_003014 [Tilletia horrida]